MNSQQRVFIMKKSYTEASIRALNYPDNVRQSPGMYIGSSTEDGIIHCFREIFDNSTDEIRESKGKRIHVVLDDEFIYVRDFGRGIPVGPSKDIKGQSTLTTIFTHLHAGGKTIDTGAYSSARGVHGVGAAVVNALSETLTVWSCRHGKWNSQKFTRGIPEGNVKASSAPSVKPAPKLEAKQGSAVLFYPDKKIFGKARIDKTRIQSLVETAAYFLPGVTFTLAFDGNIHTYRTKGIQELVEKLALKNKSNIVSSVFSYEAADCSIALAWSDTPDPVCLSYVSGGLTEEGGTHQKALDDIVYECFIEAAGRSASKIDKKFVKAGIISVLNVGINHPQFSSQTKTKLTSPKATAMVKEAKPHLKKYFASNKALVKTLIEVCKKLQENESRFRANAVAAAKMKSPRGKIILPPKLAVSSTKNVEERELFILEGDSAGGSAKAARDPFYQEVLPIRGKFTNPYKEKNAKIFGNESVLSIFQSVGYDPSSKEPLSNIRVGKIFFLSDADEDGQHINALLAALFAKFMPSLYEEGRVFSVRAPLFRGSYKDRNFYGSSISQIEKMSGLKNMTITRFKGWGEAGSDELRDIAFDPAKRRLIRLKPLTSKKLIRVEAIIGEDISVRKQLLGIAE